MAKAARGKPEEVALPVRFLINVQAGERLTPGRNLCSRIT
jgi:hypothetical protein